MQFCTFWFSSAVGGGGGGLPAGPWPSLRDLVANWDVLVRSGGVLPTLRQLECLQIDSTPKTEACTHAQWDAFWDWAHEHPPLKEVTLAMEAPAEQTVVHELLLLQRCHPHLLVSIL